MYITIDLRDREDARVLLDALNAAYRQADANEDEDACEVVGVVADQISEQLEED